MATSSLNITSFVEGQDSPDVTINAALNILDAALCELKVIDIAADANLNITATGATPQQWQYAGFKITDVGLVLTAGRNVILPNVEKKLYILVNATGAGYALTLKTSAGTGIAVADTKAAILYCDGTNVIRITADA